MSRIEVIAHPSAGRAAKRDYPRIPSIEKQAVSTNCS
jgi:hypothetical protein